MNKLIAFVLALVCALGLGGCSSKWIEGSEKTYYGTVTDSAMSVVNEGDRQGRAYVIISTADNTEMRFWIHKDCKTPTKIGDKVMIESAIEEQTNLLVAVRIVVS